MADSDRALMADSDPTPKADSERTPKADPDLSPSPPAASPLSTPSKKDDLGTVGDKIAELNESQTELMSRLQGLKQDLQNWRSKLDTQVKTYKDELSELRTALDTELDTLRSDFQELKTTLQKQQEDVTTSLRNLGLQDAPEHFEQSETTVKEDDSNKEQALLSESSNDTDPVAESST